MVSVSLIFGACFSALGIATQIIQRNPNCQAFFENLGICYANLFSYKAVNFISQNREIQRAIRNARWVFPGLPIRFVMDAGASPQLPYR